MHFYPTAWYGSVRDTMPSRQYLLAASSWARFLRKDGSIRPARLPSRILGCAVDPGAYAATIGGGYHYTFQQYLQWIKDFELGQVAWAGTMDFCCIESPTRSRRRREVPWIEEASDGDRVRALQIKTTVNAYETFWSNRDTSFLWVPTVQGLATEEYVWHARDLRDLVAEMQAFYGSESAFRVGIGSLCRPMPQGQLHDIIREVAAVLPNGIRFHLWGTKLGTFQHLKLMLPDCVISCDSSMWSGQQRRVGGHGTDKMWRASGKTQMEFAYDHLPVYEQEIQRALAKIRPQPLLDLPLETELPHPGHEAIRQDAFNKFLDAMRNAEQDMTEIPYPYGAHWLAEVADDEEWYLT